MLEQVLVTTSQASQILGLSLQGIHYRIKNNQLKSLKKNNKTYVYISKHLQEEREGKETLNSDNIYRVIEVKDEQISLLKESMGWMKTQYQEEIKTIKNNQKKIIKVFNHERTLLQNAFNEMRAIYKNNNKQISTSKQESIFMSIKDFFLLMKKYNKSDIEIKALILSRAKKRDKRFIFNKERKELSIIKSDYLDLI